MKKILILLTFVLSVACFYIVTYAEDNLNEAIIQSNNELRLTPYKNFKDEGQISSNEIVVKNPKSTAQKVYFKLIGTDGSTIELKDKSVISNDFGEEKTAFVHLMNMETGEKTLIYNIDEQTVVGEVAPNSKIVFKICGELNFRASWKLNDRLSLSTKIYFDENSEDVVTTGESIQIADNFDYIQPVEENGGSNNSDLQKGENLSEEKESVISNPNDTNKTDSSTGEEQTDSSQASSDSENNEESDKTLEENNNDLAENNADDEKGNDVIESNDDTKETDEVSDSIADDLSDSSDLNSDSASDESDDSFDSNNDIISDESDDSFNSSDDSGSDEPDDSCDSSDDSASDESDDSCDSSDDSE